jgi:aryl-alcohol dehydrogenase-like predicted oxidoreductase
MHQVRYIGVSNETSYGVMEFVHAAKVEGLPKIVSIQNSYSLLVRSRFEGKYSSDINHISLVYHCL